MIVRFTIIDQRLLPTSHSVFTGRTSNKAPATPYHLGRHVSAFAWYYSGWYGEWETGGEYLQGDKCGEGKPKQGRVATVYCAYWFLGYVLRWISSI